jgi:hypothetical protein
MVIFATIQSGALRPFTGLNEKSANLAGFTLYNLT